MWRNFACLVTIANTTGVPLYTLSTRQCTCAPGKGGFSFVLYCDEHRDFSGSTNYAIFPYLTTISTSGMSYFTFALDTAKTHTKVSLFGKRFDPFNTNVSLENPLWTHDIGGSYSVVDPRKRNS